MIWQRIRLALTLVVLCLFFCAAEIGVFRLTRIPIAQSLELASSGPLAMHTHTLLDHLNEWRAQTPELMGMLYRVIDQSLVWSACKALAFPWVILAALYPRQARALGLRALGGFLLQLIALGLPRLLLYAGLAYCAQGLMGSDPFVRWALLAVMLLLTMLQVSCDLALTKVIKGSRSDAGSFRPAFAALGAWFTTPGTMLSAWVLRVAQLAVAAGPVYEQIKAQPGPSSPQSVMYFVAATFLLWALRLGILARLPTTPRA